MVQGGLNEYQFAPGDAAIALFDFSFCLLAGRLMHFVVCDTKSHNRMYREEENRVYCT
jgi:hypothetical protein